MLNIQVGETAAQWDEEELEWRSSDVLLAQELNRTLPTFSVSDPFLEGGCQQLALTAAKEMFGKLLTVVDQSDPPLPEEQEGVED